MTNSALYDRRRKLSFNKHHKLPRYVPFVQCVSISMICFIVLNGYIDIVDILIEGDTYINENSESAMREIYQKGKWLK